MMHRRDALKALATTVGGMALAGPALGLTAEADPPKVPNFAEAPVKTQELARGLHLLTGPGGNMAVSLGAGGAALIDSGVPQRSGAIKDAIADLGKKPVRFLLNTHWHFDHVGGNEFFAKAGAVIVAHQNTRKRMSTEQTIAFMKAKMPASPKVALPVVTFGDTGALHHEDTAIEAYHIPAAHTDTDAAYRLPGADVLHAGDLFFNGFYPFIDYSSGGTLEGLVKGLDRVLELVGPKTKVIPGHGPLGTKAELKAYRDMLAEVRDRIRPLIDDKKTLDEVIAAKPTRALDEKWGKGFLDGDTFTRMLYEGMTAKK